MGRAVGGRVDGVRGLRAPCHLRHIVTEHIIDDGKKNEGENFKVKTAHNMWRGLLNERRNKFSKSSNQKTKVSAIVQHAPLPARPPAPHKRQ